MSEESVALAPPAQRHLLREQQAQRARLAERLMASAPRAAAHLSWAVLDSAPSWLGWREDDLLALQQRVGGVFCAPALRLWIDAPRVQAVRAALGAEFHQALVRRSDRARAAALPAEMPDWPQGEQLQAPEVVAELLRSCGAAVLVCTLPHGALRHAASQALAPLAELMMPAAHAQALVDHAIALSMVAQPVPPVVEMRA